MSATPLLRPPPPDRIPDRPPELDGRARDDVTLVVTTGTDDLVTRFRALPSLLRPGDLLVVNDSATLPASLPIGDGQERLHLSTPTADGDRIVEVRVATRHGSLPAIADHAGRRLPLPEDRVPGLLALLDRGAPSGRHRLADELAGAR